jgi:hypothetical protein
MGRYYAKGASMKAALEKEIFDSILELEANYGVFFDSIRSKKDEPGEYGTLNGFKVNFVDEDFEKISAKDLNHRLSFYNDNYSSIESERVVASYAIDGRGFDMPASDILGLKIFGLISNFEIKHNVCFKSVKNKKDKDKRLTSITIDFTGGDIPVVEITAPEAPVLTRKYHLKEHEQKTPDGYQIYDDRLEVAGIQHRRDAAAQFVNQTNQWLEFESEPLNSYYSYAIKVLGCYLQNEEVIKLHVGYVPASIAEQITNFSADKCKARLLKTYIGVSGYVEILFQVLGPKGKQEEYALFYVKTDEDDDEDD